MSVASKSFPVNFYLRLAQPTAECRGGSDGKEPKPLKSSEYSDRRDFIPSKRILEWSRNILLVVTIVPRKDWSDCASRSLYVLRYSVCPSKPQISRMHHQWAINPFEGPESLNLLKEFIIRVSHESWHKDNSRRVRIWSEIFALIS